MVHLHCHRRGRVVMVRGHGCGQGVLYPTIDADLTAWSGVRTVYQEGSRKAAASRDSQTDKQIDGKTNECMERLAVGEATTRGRMGTTGPR